jgi:hypothetical protein
MGLTTLIAVIAILIFSIVFVVPILANIDDIANDGLICGVLGICSTPTEETEKFKEEVEKQEQEADKVLPITTGKTMCDLQVFVDAKLVDDFGFLKIKIDESDPSNYQWHCQFPNQWGFLNNMSFNPMAFFFESEFIHAEIKLIDKDNKSRWYDANHEDYKEMYREIRLTDTTGFVNTPLNIDQTFYIDNIVHDDYILEIYYGRVINNLDAGEPIIDSVCMVGNHPC